MNIWFSSGENPELSNLAKRPFTFEGKDYVSVEHAYQTLKGFNFDERVYKAYPKGAGVKIVGSNKPYTKGNWNLQLMETLIRESFIQNPRALRFLQATGESVLTHYQDTGIWKKEFPRILMKVRDELKNLGVFDPLKHLINGFRTWYMNNSPEQYSFLGDSDYWAESWFIFKEQVEISSPLVYLFYIGYLPESLWLAYKENKQGTFKQVEQEAIEKGRLVENQGEMFDGWDWSETDLYQPKWVEGKKSLEQFCLTVLEDFPPQYSVEVLNPDYWVSYHLYSEEEANSLIEHIITNYPQPQLTPKLISPSPVPTSAHPMSEPHKFINTPISQAIPGVLGISDTPWK